MRMHILQVAAHLPPRYQGGAEVYTDHLIGELARQGERISVFYIGEMDRKGGSRSSEHRYHRQGIDFVALSLRNDRLDSAWHYFHQPDVATHLRATLRRTRPDIVHIQGGFRLSGAALATVLTHPLPVIVTLHDYYYLCPRVNLWTTTSTVCSSSQGGANCPTCVASPCGESGEHMEDWMAETSLDLRSQLASGRRYLRRTLRRAPLLLAPSQYLAQTYMARGGVDPSRISLHRLGLPAALQPQHTSDPATARPLHVAYIGHLHPHKGINTLLRAMQRLKALDSALKLTIHGVCADSLDYAQRLQQQASGLASVTFAPAYPNDRLPALLSQTDVVVVPSVWPENAPLVVSAALRMGVPVVASRIGGLPEMIDDGQNGLLFEPGDDITLAKYLAKLARSPARRSHLASHARYERTTEQEVLELRARYRTLLCRPPRDT